MSTELRVPGTEKNPTAEDGCATPMSTELRVPGTEKNRTAEGGCATHIKN